MTLVDFLTLDILFLSNFNRKKIFNLSISFLICALYSVFQLHIQKIYRSSCTIPHNFKLCEFKVKMFWLLGQRISCPRYDHRLSFKSN